MEGDMLAYLFKDARAFVSRIIAIFMDETFGRDHIVTFFKLLNVAAPMLLMNDYRVSKQANALGRVQLLEGLVKSL